MQNPNNDIPALSTVGDASFDAASGEYVLTDLANWQAGFVNSVKRIDLSQAATITFDMFFGTKDGDGADGGGFVFHNDLAGASAIGQTGRGRGLVGLQNAIAIEFDTYQNEGELANDHTAFFDPDGSFSSTPVDLGNLEDGAWRSVTVSWDPQNLTLSYSIDGVVIGTLESNIVEEYLGGSQFAYFGVAAATGKLNNLQKVRFTGVDAAFESAASAPVLSIAAPADVLEGDPGTSGSLVFTATLDQAAGPGGVTADVLVTGGNGFTPSQIVIPEGESSTNVTVTFSGDTTPEPDETVTVTLSNVANALGGQLSASAAILDDDDLPAFATVGDASFDAASGGYVLTNLANWQTGIVNSVERIDLSQAATITFDMSFGTKDGDGADGGGFVFHNDLAGASAIGQTGRGRGLVGLQNAIAIEFDTYQNEGELANDHTAFFDPDGSFSSTPVDLGNLEDGAWRSVTVSWDPQNLTLSYSIDGVVIGTLESNIVEEYLGGSQFAYFGVAAATGKLNNLQKVRFTGVDAAFESAASAPVLSIAAPADVLEGDPGTSGSLVFTATLDQAAGPGGVTADVLVTGGNGFTPSQIVIPEGESSTNVTVTFSGDTTPEPDETVTVTLSNVANALGGQLSASAAILDDDDLPAFATVGDASFDAASGGYVLTNLANWQTGIVNSVERIDLSQAATITFDMSFGTKDGDGADGGGFVFHNDLAGASAIGQTGRGRGLVGLQNAIAIEFDTYQNEGELANDHTAFFDPDGSFSSTPVDLGNLEDGAWRSVTVSWDPQNLTLSYSIDGVVIGTLESNIVEEYLGGSQFAYFGVAAATGKLNNLQKVRFTGVDAAFENAAPAPVLSIAAPADVLEGDSGTSGSLVFTATLDQAAGPGGVTADVSVTGGGSFLPSQIVIPEGALSTDVTVTFSGDTTPEPDETVTVSLSNVANALGGQLSASAAILDDDLTIAGEIALESDQISVGEADGVARVAIVRNGDLSTTATITYGVTDDTATNGPTGAGGDYELSPTVNTITMQPGESRVVVDIAINDDQVSEATETFIVSLINVEGSMLTAPRTTRVDILDDENPVIDPPQPPLVSPYEVTLTPIISENLAPITAFEFLPSDPTTLLVAEKRGFIKAFDLSPLETGGSPAYEGIVLDIGSIVNNVQDRGLLDIAIHPDLANNPYLYAFYVVDPSGVDQFSGNAGPDGGGNRFSHLVRYTLDESTGYKSIVEGSDVIILGAGGQTLGDISGTGALDFTDPVYEDEVASDILDNTNPADPVFKEDYLKVDSRSHAGGALAFGPDGALYVSTGDGTSFNFADPRSFYVQDIDSLAGKILRIDPITGEGLADNPFYDGDPEANQSKVYQLGLRNPFSMGFDQDGQLLITNTGWSSWEEIYQGGPGANYGWPYYEGGDNGVLLLNNRYASREEVAGPDPIFTIPDAAEITAAFRAFSHRDSDPGFQVQAITGGDAFYSGDVYPTALDGAYFFADASQGEVFAINPDDRRDVTFLIKREGSLAPVHFSQGPDGYIYYADFAYQIIGRLEITEPVSSITLEPLVDVTEADQNLATTSESETLYSFVATLSSPVGGDVTVTYTASLGGTIVETGELFFDADGSDPFRSSVTLSLPADAQIVADQILEITLSDIVVGPGVDPARVAFAGGGATLVETANVLEDDAPRLSIAAPANQPEGDAGIIGNLFFTATLDQVAGPGGVTADVTVTGGHGFAPSQIVIPEGQRRAFITVDFTGDDVFDDDETVTVTLSNVTNALGGQLSASAAILDDDALPALATVGDASFDAASGEYVLTNPATWQTGMVNSVEQLDLSQAVTITFDMFFGTKDADGADGGGFVFHNDLAGASAIGQTGSDRGLVGLQNAIAIEFDTYQNEGELANDHTAFFDPDGSFSSTPVDLGNLEDGAWRSITVTWDPQNLTLSSSIDGVVTGTLESNIVEEYLGGSQFAYFGVAAATGKLNNLQKVRFTGVDTANASEATLGDDALAGTAGNDAVNLLAGNDTYDGLGGADTIIGGLGNDTLTGGAGDDLFVFNAALSASNVDTITDFVVGSDAIALDNAVFTELNQGPLSAEAFVVGTTAADTSNRIIYDNATGAVSYDADGTGEAAQERFAQLDALLAISETDFFVI